ncbi:MAG: AI-2E family transporter [Nanoarchaeota archaeon]|nr:AI-2E family transporter [Nanoarchaeota archaeon]
MDPETRHSKYFFLVCFLFLIVLSLYLLRHYLVAVFAAMVLAYIFYPLYKRLHVYIRNRSLAAFTMSFLLVVVTLVPALFAANALVNESVKFFHEVNSVEHEDLLATVENLFGDQINLGYYLKELLNKLSLYIANSTSGFILSLPSKVLSAFIMVFIMYYLFKEGKGFVAEFKDWLPLRPAYKERMSQQFDEVVYAVLFGVVVTAFIQGIAGTLGLWVFGVDSPLLLGLIMTLCAMLPFVGPWVVWLPAAFLKIMAGDNVNGIGLLVYGLLVVSTLDNIVRPKLIGMKSKVHPAVVLLGVLGGLSTFGILGVIVGPLILAIALEFFRMYLKDQDALLA